MYLAADERDCCTTFESDCVIAKVLPYFWMSLAGADGVIDVSPLQPIELCTLTLCQSHHQSSECTPSMDITGARLCWLGGHVLRMIEDQCRLHQEILS